MEVLRQNVGVDIAKDSFVATYTSLLEGQELKHHSTKKFNNDKKGFDNFLEWTSKYQTADISESYTMEATGVYYESLAFYLIENERKIHVLLPNKVKKFGESLDVKSKTDEIDSKILGQIGVERKLKNWELNSVLYRSLKKLSREREQIIGERSILKNQIHAESHSAEPLKSTLKRMNSRVLSLGKHLKAIDKELCELVKTDSELSKKIDQILTIPGVGFVTAITIIAETQGFINMKNIKQLTSYAGLDVQLKESGNWSGKPHISKKGNSRIRKALYMPSLSSIQYNKQYKAFYERVTPKKVNGLIALTAIQRKLLGLMYTLWKNDTDYDENYQSKNQ